ncbi:hypothetical protein H311_00418, partial [Anncaliia algerae PRA109]
TNSRQSKRVITQTRYIIFALHYSSRNAMQKGFKLNTVATVVTKVENFIQGHVVNHRQFLDF